MNIESIENLTGHPLAAALSNTPAGVDCPARPEMKISLSSIVKKLRAGNLDELLGGQAIWACTGCRRCSELLGPVVDFSLVMDALRALAIERGAGDPAAEFYKTCIRDVRRRGRLHARRDFVAGLMPVGRGALAAALFFKRKAPLTSSACPGWEPPDE